MPDQIKCSECVEPRKIFCDRMFTGSSAIVADEFDIETEKGTSAEILLNVAPVVRQSMIDSLSKNLGKIGCELDKDQIANKINERL